MNSISKRVFGFCVAAAVAAGFAAAAPARAGVIPVYASGHCDLCADYDADERQMHAHYHFHAGSPGYDEAGNPLEGEYEPSTLHTRASDATKATVPDDPRFAFLGQSAGANAWILPQNGATGVPFLGFGTEELDPDDWSTGITYALIGVSGPGQFSMWMSQPLGDPIVHWATSDGIDSSDVYTQAALGHSHANWGFTAEGVYDVQMQISGTLADGTTVVSSEVETFTFLVGSDTVANPGPGDANGDGIVDDRDASILGANWRSTDANWWRGDFTGDRIVNDSDAAILAAHWGSPATQESAPVPEPGGVAMLAVGGAALALASLRRRSKRTVWYRILAATAALCVGGAPPADADSLPVFVSGATHLGLKYEGGELLLQYHIPFEATAEDGVTKFKGRYDSDALYTRVPDPSKTTLTSGQAAQLSFLGGLSEGDDVWILPQVQDPAMPFLGFGSGLTAADWQSTDIALKLVGHSGPGEFALWSTDGLGALTAPWTTSNGLDDSDVYGLPVDGGHTHANWGFTEEGVYRLTVEASCTLLGGGVRTDTETFTFLVGSNTVPEPGTIALLCSGAIGVCLRLWKRRRGRATRG